jgi:hypothetical protein
MLKLIKTARLFGQKLLFQLQIRYNSKRFLKPVENFYQRTGPGRGNALLIYRAMPFHLPPSHPSFNFHQSMIQSRLIASALDQLGYRVDIIDHTGDMMAPLTSYDVVVCHKSDADPETPTFANAIKIYLASGTEHKTHNVRQQQRLEDFRKRMGELEVELTWDKEDMPWAGKADAIFCFGNEQVAATWRKRFGGNVLPFQNTAIHQLPELRRQWTEESKHFLFLGSRQQLAKGLDLLLEAFAGCPELHLHVCGHYLKDVGFCKAYDKLLFNTENIHTHGWVDVTSPSFLELASKCAFTISATCAEGSPGSITNAMKLGMIPILPKEAGVDGGEGVILMENLSIEGISIMIAECSAKQPEELRHLSGLSTLRAERDFTESAFEARWIQMLQEVIPAPPATLP